MNWGFVSRTDLHRYRLFLVQSAGVISGGINQVVLHIVFCFSGWRPDSLCRIRGNQVSPRPQIGDAKFPKIVGDRTARVMEIDFSHCKANPHSTDTHIVHRIAVEICDLPGDHGSRLHVKDQVRCVLLGLHQNRRRPLTAGRLNKARMLDCGHVSSRCNIVDLESTIRIGCVGILATGLAIACAELHICFSYWLASELLQDLALYGYARSVLSSGILKCEGSRDKAKKSDQEAFH